MNASYLKKLSVMSLIALGALFVVNGLSFNHPGADDMLLLMVGLTVGMLVLVAALAVQAMRPRHEVPEQINPISDEMVSAMFLAREETELTGQATITDVHLLRGLLRTRGSVAEVALTRAGVSLAQLPEPLPQPAGNFGDVASGQVPMSITAEICLRIAREEAQSIGDSQVRTGHVLMSLMREDVSGLSALLAEAGLNRDAVVAMMVASRQ